ncbi:hypothetical protein [Hymenobacter terricola]|uniref:hypothetical protein n=1 Tax=Hymenobacter terricola TaxID=2819236 RepID=UPI001B304247|nr:hypothetical protein [Hymenobacter terricola]
MSDLTQTLVAEQRALGEKWLDISIERYRANLRRLKIGQTGELYNSFQGAILGNRENELKMRLVYAMQGLYVDQGVGRGMGAGVTKAQGAEYRRFRNEKGHLHRHVRKAKRWYAKQSANEIHRLGVLVSDLTGSLLVASASAALPEQAVEITF